MAAYSIKWHCPKPADDSPEAWALEYVSQMVREVMDHCVAVAPSNTDRMQSAIAKLMSETEVSVNTGAAIRALAKRVWDIEVRADWGAREKHPTGYRITLICNG